jgi:hypothetical protein
MYEAHERLRKKEPIIKKDLGEGKEFVFSLAKGETIELNNDDGTRGLYIVRMLSKADKRIRFVPIDDARILKEISTEGRRPYPDGLRKLNCKKVTVTPLGEVRYAND